MYKKTTILAVLILLFSVIVIAQDIGDNQTDGVSGNDTTTIPDGGDTTTTPEDVTTTPEPGDTTTTPEPEPTESTTPEPEAIVNFELVNMTPSSVKKGDVLLTLTLKNTGNTDLTDLTPLISGKGFSSYEVVPVYFLAPGEEADAAVMGKFDTEGNILLTIKIQRKSFYQAMEVKSDAPEVDPEQQRQIEEAKKATLKELSGKLSDLEANYTALEDEYVAKKDKYDVSTVKLDELKGYLRNARSAIIMGEVDKAKVNIDLANEEYIDMKTRLDRAQKKPLMSVFKENIVIISTIAGSLITLFTLYELLKKKQEKVVTKIKEVNVGKSARMRITEIISFRRKKDGKTEEAQLADTQKAASDADKTQNAEGKEKTMADDKPKEEPASAESKDEKKADDNNQKKGSKKHKKGDKRHKRSSKRVDKDKTPE